MEIKILDQMNKNKIWSIIDMIQKSNNLNPTSVVYWLDK